jgi:hypothetical protein
MCLHVGVDIDGDEVPGFLFFMSRAAGIYGMKRASDSRFH